MQCWNLEHKIDFSICDYLNDILYIGGVMHYN